MSRAPARTLILVALLTLSGCSMRSIAVEAMSEMLASGDSVFTEDDDVELVGEALPFSLKLVESLLAEAPDNRGLLLTAARGYVLYAYAYVHFPAEKAALEDLTEARRLRARARKLYLRAFDYALRGLEVGRPGLRKALRRTPEQALAGLDADPTANVPYLYWGASALGLAISVSKDDAAMLARLPEVDALLRYALALDEGYDEGALHEFAVVWGGASMRPADRATVGRHYQRALELSRGRRASLFVAYAMTVAVPRQDRQQFLSLIRKALAVDPDAAPRARLQTTIAQRRARWLLDRTGELFLE